MASSDLVNMGITVVSYTLKDIRDEEVSFDLEHFEALSVKSRHEYIIKCCISSKHGKTYDNLSLHLRRTDHYNDNFCGKKKNTFNMRV